MKLTVHSETTAPDASKPILEGVRKAYGFLPNMLGTMAEAPALLKGYQTLGKIFQESSLSAAEQQVVILTTSYENACTYCVAAHTVIAAMSKVPSDVVQAIRAGNPIADPKLEALRQLASEIVTTRGWPRQETLRRFLAAGYTQANVLEVVLGVGLKTLSNYTNHLAATPLDGAFASAAWTSPQGAAAVRA
jgi:uncharacterized peroxidase-related enzyme